MQLLDSAGGCIDPCSSGVGRQTGAREQKPGFLLAFAGFCWLLLAFALPTSLGLPWSGIGNYGESWTSQQQWQRTLCSSNTAFFLRAVGLAHITITRASQHAAPRLCGAPGAAVNQGKRRRAASGVQPKLVTGQIHSTVITRNKHRYPRGHHIDRMRCGCQVQALL